MCSSNMRDIYKRVPQSHRAFWQGTGTEVNFLDSCPCIWCFLVLLSYDEFLEAPLAQVRPLLGTGGHLHGGGLLAPLQRWEQRRGRPGSGVLDVGDHAVQWAMGAAMGAHLVLSLLLAVEFPLARPEGCQMASKGKSIL